VAQHQSIAAIILLAIVTAGCAGKTTARPTTAAAMTPSSRVMVMAPVVVGAIAPGNVGRDFPKIEAEVTTRILSIVRERFSSAAVAASSGSSPPAPRLVGYDSAAGHAVTPGEMNAAIDARAHGSTHLLVPVITEWKQMRAGDPIGALILPHNSVTMTLRLMRLEPPALIAQTTFHNQSRVTLNQPAIRLLDARFRRAILQLLGD